MIVSVKIRLDRRLVDNKRLDASTWAHTFYDDPIQDRPAVRLFMAERHGC